MYIILLFYLEILWYSALLASFLKYTFLSWLVAQLQYRPVNHKAVGLILGAHGTYLGCRLGPWSGHIQEAVNPYFSLTSVFSSPFSQSLPFKQTKKYSFLFCSFKTQMTVSCTPYMSFLFFSDCS